MEIGKTVRRCASVRRAPLLLAVCAMAGLIGCASEQVPNTGVAAIDTNDSTAQSSAVEVLRANNVEMQAGVYFPDGSKPPQFLILVSESAQARAAKLIAADAKARGYRVTLYSPGGTLTINAQGTGPAASARPSDGAQKTADTNELKKALAEYDEAIRLNAENAEAYFKRGVAYGKLDELDKAIADLTEAIRLNPGLADAFNARGVTWGKKGSLDKAIADLDQAIRLNPDLAKAYSNRGIVVFPKIWFPFSPTLS